MLACTWFKNTVVVGCGTYQTYQTQLSNRQVAPWPPDHTTSPFPAKMAIPVQDGNLQPSTDLIIGET